MNEKNILCFGDSNTWGFVPGAFDSKTFYMERYPLSVRWPGVVRKILGNEYYIIEEGLNGRTTNVEYPGLNGRSSTSYLGPCLYTHSPLELIVIQIGINDLKTIFNRKLSIIAEGISEMIDMVKGTLFGSDMQSPPEILLLTPPPLEHEKYLDENNNHVFKGGMEKSLQFHYYYSKIAKNKDCHYLNLGSIVKYSDIDGLHLDSEGHQIVGMVVANKIKEIFKRK